MKSENNELIFKGESVILYPYNNAYVLIFCDFDRIKILRIDFLKIKLGILVQIK